MQRSFEKGHQVRLTADAVESYGGCWENVTLEITRVSTRYMPAERFFKEGCPDGYHCGFDPTSDSALYDLKTLGGQDLPISLYDWELQLSEREENTHETKDPRNVYQAAP